MSKKWNGRQEEKTKKMLLASVALLALATGMAIAPYVLSMRDASAAETAASVVE